MLPGEVARIQPAAITEERIIVLTLIGVVCCPVVRAAVDQPAVCPVARVGIAASGVQMRRIGTYHGHARPRNGLADVMGAEIEGARIRRHATISRVTA